MLHTGLRLAADLLRTPLPGEVLAMVQADRVASQLARQICKWLPAAGYVPPALFERAAFRLRMRGGLFSAPAYLLRLSLSPTEDDWAGSGQGKNPSFLGAVRRPFRLAKKYGRAGKS